MTSSDTLIISLKSIVGEKHLLLDERQQRQYTTGYRFGEGSVTAVVCPGSLLELWKVFKLCVEHDHIILMQAANTGLNGGSTPFGDDYDRGIVLINGLRMNRIDLLANGRQALCHPGAKLHTLSKILAPLHREPHSVIGSTTIGATIIGGIANNSGGALVRRGPAYTELALYARVNENGQAELVNELGINLGQTPEEILDRLDRSDYSKEDIKWDKGRLASDPDYSNIVREIDNNTPARFNNDPRLLSGVSGSAGKVCAFAVRVDTFEKENGEAVFCLGTNDYNKLTQFRRHVLSKFEHLPIACEYLNREGHQLALEYGKDLYLFLKYLGPERISHAFAIKRWFDSLTLRCGLGNSVSDKILQLVTKVWPNHLPERLSKFLNRFEHQVFIRVNLHSSSEMQSYLDTFTGTECCDILKCTEDEATAAFRHRYAMGGAAVRYRAVHPSTVEDIIALDVAFPRNIMDWRDNIPAEISKDIAKRFPCGHFLCHTFHYDYALRKGRDWHLTEAALIKHFKTRGAEVPSEHNVGHLYEARDALIAHYKQLDPTNSLNPGIGLTSKKKWWR